MKLLFFCNYAQIHLENVFCNIIRIYVRLYNSIKNKSYLYNSIKISRIHIIVFVIPTFIHTYLARNNYSEKTAFEYM